jgi:choline dehydrogenase-like flavoprotein
MAEANQYDAVIVGAGIAGAIIAYELGKAGKRVLILEAGPSVPPNRSAYMERFYRSGWKTPSSPYPPAITEMDASNENAPRATIPGLLKWKDPCKSYLVQESENGHLPFSSTYERIGGGTTWHWMGTSLRLLPNDFRLKSMYGHGEDWPIGYEDLITYYEKAEAEIGVAADKSEQAYLGLKFRPEYQYPMPKIPQSVVDQQIAGGVQGLELFGQPVEVTSTPQGRNSKPYDSRRVCAGNTNCIPICPIQAKYDATVTLNKALNTGKVTIWYQTVAKTVQVDSSSGRISGIDYLQYKDPRGPSTGSGTATGSIYVLAAHAIETPKLLLNSRNDHFPHGVANGSGQVGRNLMDHVIYLAWALMPEGKPIYPFRGPLSTSGIESLRDGPFRKMRAAFRIEIGNEGWNWAAQDPYTTTNDFIDGTDTSQLNPGREGLFGRRLVQALNSSFTRQFRLGFLIEQDASESNCVTLSDKYKDHLGIARPKIRYNLSDYTKQGFVQARFATRQIFARLGAKEYTKVPGGAPTFTVKGEPPFTFAGAGHIIGTYRMGKKSDSVVDSSQCSWDHPNLFLVGSGVFPSEGTANPTLTIAALAFQAAETIQSRLK